MFGKLSEKTSTPSDAPPFMQELPSLPRPKGEHVRVVFKEGRDLNIFGVVDTNVQGGTLRYKDHAGDTFVVYPEKVNYLQIKQEK